MNRARLDLSRGKANLESVFFSFFFFLSSFCCFRQILSGSICQMVDSPTRAVYINDRFREIIHAWITSVCWKCIKCTCGENAGALSLQRAQVVREEGGEKKAHGKLPCKSTSRVRGSLSFVSPFFCCPVAILSSSLLSCNVTMFLPSHSSTRYIRLVTPLWQQFSPSRSARPIISLARTIRARIIISIVRKACFSFFHIFLCFYVFYISAFPRIVNYVIHREGRKKGKTHANRT